MKFYLEKIIQVWNAETGEHIDVGPDQDGLDLVEIKIYDETNHCTNNFTMPQEQALLLADAVYKLYGSTPVWTT